jgi:hypothetical protein
MNWFVCNYCSDQSVDKYLHVYRQTKAQSTHDLVPTCVVPARLHSVELVFYCTFINYFSETQDFSSLLPCYS